MCKTIKISTICLILTTQRWWAVPGGTAIPGQPVIEVEQAPNSPSMFKNQFNIEVVHCTTYQILS